MNDSDEVDFCTSTESCTFSGTALACAEKDSTPISISIVTKRIITTQIIIILGVMFSFFAKIIKKLATYPKIILIVFLAVGFQSIYPVMHLRWDLQLQDTITSAREPSNVQKIEDEFGGLGSLIVILESKDSLANYRVAKNLAKTMEKNPSVHFADFETDIDYYKKNKFLYASENDIDIMTHRIEKLKRDYILKNNPLFIDLANFIDTLELPTSQKREQLLSDLEQKYFDKLSISHSNRAGTIRIVENCITMSRTSSRTNRSPET